MRKCSEDYIQNRFITLFPKLVMCITSHIQVMASRLRSHNVYLNRVHLRSKKKKVLNFHKVIPSDGFQRSKHVTGEA